MLVVFSPSQFCRPPPLCPRIWEKIYIFRIFIFNFWCMKVTIVRFDHITKSEFQFHENSELTRNKDFSVSKLQIVFPGNLCFAESFLPYSALRTTHRNTTNARRGQKFTWDAMKLIARWKTDRWSWWKVNKLTKSHSYWEHRIDTLKLIIILIM